MLLVHFLVAFAIFFPIVLFVITLYRAYQEDGNPTNINMFLGLLLLLALTCSCTKEDNYPPLCPSGCDATIEIGLLQNSEGYYIVPSNMDRFNVEFFASDTDSYYYYNDQAVVEASISSIFSNSTSYFSKRGSRLYTKQVIGPILDEMVGDTITISGDVYWDGGREFKIQEFSFKIIVE